MNGMMISSPLGGAVSANLASLLMKAATMYAGKCLQATAQKLLRNCNFVLVSFQNNCCHSEAKHNSDSEDVRGRQEQIREEEESCAVFDVKNGRLQQSVQLLVEVWIFSERQMFTTHVVGSAYRGVKS